METLQKSYEVFAKLLEAHGITPYRIYKATGVPQSSMSEWKRGNSMPKIDKLQKIADYFGVTVDYLLGKEEKPASKDELNIGTPYTPTHRIPILGRVPAGMPLYAEQNIEGYTMTDLNGGHEYFALRVSGDSMNAARICDGDIIIVCKQDIVENGQIAVVMVNGNDATVKRFRRDGNTVTLMPQSYNPEHTPQIYNLKDTPIRVIGKVVEVKYLLEN